MARNFRLEKRKLPSNLQKKSTFLPECITHTDCPFGGTNYVCNFNECDCPSPKVLDGDKCVGKLSFEKKSYQRILDDIQVSVYISMGFIFVL